MAGKPVELSPRGARPGSGRCAAWASRMTTGTTSPTTRASGTTAHRRAGRRPAAEGARGSRGGQPTALRGADRRRPGRGRRPDRPPVRRPGRPGEPGHPGRRQAHPGPARTSSTWPQQAGQGADGDVRRPRPGDHHRLPRRPRRAALPRGQARLRHRGPDAAHQRRRAGAPARPPELRVAKTYLADVPGPIPRDLGRRLATGVELEDGVAVADKFRVLEQAGGRALVEITLHEGRKHIVRRMLAEVGHPVSRLVRISVGTDQAGHPAGPVTTRASPPRRSASCTPPSACSHRARQRLSSGSSLEVMIVRS